METVPRGTSLDPWFVTGFSEGQARFTFSRSGRNLALYFALRVPEADTGILLAVQEFFGGIGRIYTRRSPALQSRSLYFRVTRIDELTVVVRHFDDYPLFGSKGFSYDLWRRMVELKREHYRRPEVSALEALASRLSSL